MRGIGIDIVEVNRIKSAIDKSDKFLNRVFTENEIKYYIENGENIETLAGIFAAKEAVLKVLKTGIEGVCWKDVEIIHTDSVPGVILYNRALEAMRKEQIQDILVSISHSKENAIANAIGV